MKRFASRVIAGVLVLSAVAHGMFMIADKDVPVDRVLPRVQAYADQNPKDANAQFVLARIHALAWAADGNQVRLIEAKGDDALPDFAPYASVRVMRTKDALPSEAATAHLEKSLASYRKAVELEPKNGLYRLGLAWMMEQKLATPAPSSQPATQPTDRGAELKAVIDQYLQAYELRFNEDKNKEDRLLAGDAFVAAEAAECAIRLLKTVDPVDEAQIQRLEQGRGEIFAKGMAITPVIIALDADARLEDLIDPQATVTFDLSGIGSGHRWPWVNRRAGILVWDPSKQGKITSGRQLFGTMTWQVVFRNGYEALSTLDADGDLVLAREELSGISLWRDANGNAVSDPGEVTPVSELINSIAVQATVDNSGLLHSTVTWRDGKTTRSYDWVPESKPASSQPVR